MWSRVNSVLMARLISSAFGINVHDCPKLILEAKYLNRSISRSMVLNGQTHVFIRVFFHKITLVTYVANFQMGAHHLLRRETDKSLTN